MLVIKIFILYAKYKFAKSTNVNSVYRIKLPMWQMTLFIDLTVVSFFWLIVSIWLRAKVSTLNSFFCIKNQKTILSLYGKNTQLN